MTFKRLFTIFFLCIGAVFSIVDIGSDSYLAYDYWYNIKYRSFRHCMEYDNIPNGPLSRTRHLWVEMESGEGLYKKLENLTTADQSLTVVLSFASYCKLWQRQFVPLKGSRGDDYFKSPLSHSRFLDNRFFAILTSSWIAAGGFFQFLTVVFLIYRGHAHLNILPKSIQILLLVASPILLGPFVVYVFGIVVIVESKDRLLQQNIRRYKTFSLSATT